MYIPVVSHDKWGEFLPAFTDRHAGRLLTIETHDVQTGETVTSRPVRFDRIELDLEDRSNERINLTVRDEPKEIKHILFRPSQLSLQVAPDATEEGLQIVSINTVMTIRFPDPRDVAA